MYHYLNNLNEFKLSKSILEAPSLNKQFQESVDYQGHTYSLSKVFIRHLTGKERLLVFFQCLGKMIQSMGKQLSSKQFREEWLSAFKGKQIHAIYLPKVEHKQNSISIQAADAEKNAEVQEENKKTNSQDPLANLTSVAESVQQVQEGFHSSIKNDNQTGTKPDEESSEKSTLPLKNSDEFIHEMKVEPEGEPPSQSTNKTDEVAASVESTKESIKISLRDVLTNLPIEEGLNPDYFSDETKTLFKSYIQRWDNNADRTKLYWSLEEISACLNIEENDLRELFFRLQIFHSKEVPINISTMDWLLRSISDAIENKFSGRMRWSVKMIWQASNLVFGKENRFPKGTDRAFWNLDELSMFLAVKKESLQKFLDAKFVADDEKQGYSSQAISAALRYAKPFDLNTMLENQRTQQNSLRFATDQCN